MDSNLRREIILDNYQEPMNRGLIEDDSYIKTRTSSESCIDDLSFMMKIEIICKKVFIICFLLILLYI